MNKQQMKIQYQWYRKNNLQWHINAKGVHGLIQISDQLENFISKCFASALANISWYISDPAKNGNWEKQWVEKKEIRIEFSQTKPNTP